MPRQRPRCCGAPASRPDGVGVAPAGCGSVARDRTAQAAMRIDNDVGVPARMREAGRPCPRGPSHKFARTGVGSPRCRGQVSALPPRGAGKPRGGQTCFSAARPASRSRQASRCAHHAISRSHASWLGSSSRSWNLSKNPSRPSKIGCSCSGSRDTSVSGDTTLIDPRSSQAPPWDTSIPISVLYTLVHPVALRTWDGKRLPTAMPSWSSIHRGTAVRLAPVSSTACVFILLPSLAREGVPGALILISAAGTFSEI